jgi:prevent-host-death family protein
MVITEKTMTQTVSATDAKANLSGLINWAVDNDDAVIVQSYGNPKAAIISYAAYQRFLAWEEQARREAALTKLSTLAEIIRSRNQDLSQRDVDELAERFVQDVLTDMAAEGKVQYGADEP